MNNGPVKGRANIRIEKQTLVTRGRGRRFDSQSGRGVSADGLYGLRNDTLPLAAPSPMKEASINKSLPREMGSLGEVK